MGVRDLRNLPERLLWCQKCHQEQVSTQPEALCCGVPLITVLFSELTGQRITGRSDLKQRLA